jgi:hypothetical protein
MYLRDYKMTSVACRSLMLHCTSRGSTGSGKDDTQPPYIGFCCPVSPSISVLYRTQTEFGILFYKMKCFKDRSHIQTLLFPAYGVTVV